MHIEILGLSSYHTYQRLVIVVVAYLRLCSHIFVRMYRKQCVSASFNRTMCVRIYTYICAILQVLFKYLDLSRKFILFQPLPHSLESEIHLLISKTDALPLEKSIILCFINPIP